MYLFVFFCCRREYKSSEFELHEVFAIDIIISTGDGKVSVIVSIFVYAVLGLKNKCGEITMLQYV